MSRSLALGAYLAVSVLAEPFGRHLLVRRARRGKEDPARSGERLGVAGRPRPDGRLLWLHAASVGEAVSALPLLEAIATQDPALTQLVTTGTVTAARRLEGALPARTLHQYVPIDTRAAVRGFLDHWRPDAAVWIESEIWPRLVHETAGRGVPMALVNARLSERSTARWARLPAMARRLFGAFRWIVAQDGETVARLAGLGCAAEAGGSLKSAVVPPEPDALTLAQAREALGARPVWLAASTHAGEEALVAEVHAGLGGDALLILAPRHPDRGAEVTAILEAAGLGWAQRSRGELPDSGTPVWLADTLGEMGVWYRLAPVVFVGGSVVPRGGHTPFEPAACEAAILHGPRVENFREAYAALTERGAAREVSGAAALQAAVSALLSDPVARGEMARRASEVRAALTPNVAALAARVLALMERP